MARASGASGNGDAADDVASAIDDIADDLYALPADDFVAARNDRAKAARAAGAREVAAAIAKLAKPNAAAWLANQLARAHADDVRALVDLGASMRDATASLDRDELRRLSTQQRQLMASLVREARAIAEAAGVRPNEATIRGLEEILHAALAEPDAAEDLTAGRLTGTLRSSGFPSGDMAMWSPPESSQDTSSRGTTSRGTTTRGMTTRASAPAGGRSKVGASARSTGRRQAEDGDGAHDEQQRALSEERRALTEAAAAADEDRDAAHADLERADQAVRDARVQADRMRRQLDEAVDALTAAEQDRRAARTRAEQADRAARLAGRRLDAKRR
ncbi:MAG TPA: hypothetical protein VE132_13045 [Micromonosporaceae bacterium]|nr:hypothetical protein [Micromonosporaceae bacterium]